MRRIGLLGGSFNPIHRGHLSLAACVYHELQLERLLLIPSAQPPHKQGSRELAPAEDRLEMARLAARPFAWLEVCDLELHRPGRSYTVDTVLQLRESFPDARLLLVVGGDWWQGMRGWNRAELLFSLIELVCVNRPGFTGPLPELPTRVHAVSMRPDPISSTQIREHLRANRDISGLVPEPVETYIRARQLYAIRSLPMASVMAVTDLKEADGQEVTVRGWLYNKRSKGKLVFLLVRDGSGIVQVVFFKKNVPAEVFEAAKGVAQENSLTVRGRVKVDERAPGGVELDGLGLEIHQQGPEYPISKQAHGADFLLSHRHLWLRSKLQHATLRIRDRVKRAIVDFLAERGFVNIDAPIFTPNACEGTSTLFEVDYFEDQKAYLTQSGQLYMEAAAMAFGKVYCFGPAFRAEKSKTRKHLTEFWMVEPEVAYIDFDGIVQLIEDFVHAIIRALLDDCSSELQTLERDPELLRNYLEPFARMTYREAAAVLSEKSETFSVGQDFGAPDEQVLGDLHGKPVFITHWPKDIKAFYMKKDPSNLDLVLGVDLIAPEGYGELVGGGQREDDLERLEQGIAQHDLPAEAFRWYTDLRTYGSVPHGGFGLGLERTVAWLCGRPHVRECIPFPRSLNRIYP